MYRVFMLLVLATGCANYAKYIDVDKLDESHLLTRAKYIIGKGDVLNIAVLNQPTLGGRTLVRSDGCVSLTFVNDVVAAGRSPEQLGRELEASLKHYLQMPVVTVSVETSKNLSISVLGEVMRPGVYPLENGSNALHAVAAAGGLTEFAGSGTVLVIRNQPAMRVRMSYKNLVRGFGNAQLFYLRDGDTLVIE